MLLIAAPKSASTSLACTIAEIGNIDYKLGIPKTENDIPCQGFLELKKYHCNMIERNKEFIDQVTKGRKTLFKEHLLPTDRHQLIMSKITDNYCILIRNPDDICDAYKRHDVKHFEKYGSHIDLEQIKSDIERFVIEWTNYSKTRDNCLMISYEQLLTDYEKTMKKILTHYGLKYDTIKQLKRCNYTGVGEGRLL